MKSRTYSRVLTASVSTLALLGTATSAFAQIEEIIVSAEKRSESVQDVSASITALTGDGLDELGINDVSRLELVVPGVNFAFIGNDAKFNVRGANSNNTFNDAASIVGTFVDGVYKNRASQQSLSFFDVDRLEFLKGPQGTLYGRNTLAGALNLQTNRPDFSEVYGGLDIGAERFDTFAVEAFVNLPVSDTISLRLSGLVGDTGGYVKNLAGRDLGDTTSKAIRGQLLWEPTDQASFLAKIQHYTEDGSSLGVFSYTGICRPVNANGRTDQTGTTLDCRNPRRGSAGSVPFDQLGPYTVEHDFVHDGNVDETLASLEINYDLGALAVKYIGSYTDYENFLGFDGDASGTNFERFWNVERSDSFTSELQLTSTTDSALSWLVGAYYSNDDQFFSFLDFRETVDNNDNPNGATALVNNDTVLNGFFADSTFLQVDTFGLFGQLEYAITDQLRIGGGARYNREDKTLDGGGSNFTANGPVTLVPGLDLNPRVVPSDPFAVFAIDRNASGAVELEESFDKVTWKVFGEYDVNENILLYATVGTGFLSGALNRNGNITDQQESTNYEVGLKTLLAGGTLQLNVSAYYTEYDNLLTQSQVVDPNTGNVITFAENGGDIEAKGIEADFIYAPNDRLRINGGLSLLDSEYGTFGTGNVLQDVDGVPAGFIDLSGTETPWSPDFSGNIGISYSFPLGGQRGSIVPSVQSYYSSSYQASAVIPFSEVARQDSYTKTDLRLTWESDTSNYSVQAFVENIEDEAVNARVNVGGNDFVQTSFLYPRNYGVRLKSRF